MNRIGVRKWSPLDKTFFRTELENGFMKTIARPETVRSQRNAARPRNLFGAVDQVMIEERATAFTKRSIKTSAKIAGLKLAVSMMDLTTLEGKDTPGKIAFLCRKAMQPLDSRYEVASCAAVCVYPNMVRFAKKFLGNSWQNRPCPVPSYRRTICDI